MRGQDQVRTDQETEVTLSQVNHGRVEIRALRESEEHDRAREGCRGLHDV